MPQKLGIPRQRIEGEDFYRKSRKLFRDFQNGACNSTYVDNMEPYSVAQAFAATNAIQDKSTSSNECDYLLKRILEEGQPQPQGNVKKRLLATPNESFNHTVLESKFVDQNGKTLIEPDVTEGSTCNTTESYDSTVTFTVTETETLSTFPALPSPMSAGVQVGVDQGPAQMEEIPHNINVFANVNACNQEAMLRQPAIEINLQNCDSIPNPEYFCQVFPRNQVTTDLQNNEPQYQSGDYNYGFDNVNNNGDDNYNYNYNDIDDDDDKDNDYQQRNTQSINFYDCCPPQPPPPCCPPPPPCCPPPPPPCCPPPPQCCRPRCPPPPPCCCYPPPPPPIRRANGFVLFCVFVFMLLMWLWRRCNCPLVVAPPPVPVNNWKPPSCFANAEEQKLENGQEQDMFSPFFNLGFTPPAYY